MKFYKITDVYLGKQHTFEPKIPNNYWTKIGLEDNKKERICICPTIKQCLMAISSPLINKELFVYSIWSSSAIKAGLVPDKDLTDEHWLLSDTKFNFEYKIKIKDSVKSYPFKVLENIFGLWSFKYEIVQNSYSI